ncbi:non-heme iron oxygenase ferredoxin subunit [Eubacteriaceae bacterium ES3]|nr:non-heme iron oxygenase ferredoxin subunit [Eubacteriaceae bacterium ES3]
MRYMKVVSIEELKPGTMKKFIIAETPILLSNLEGTYYAIDDTCPHMGGSLSAGKLEGQNVICPRHGSVFDVKTGSVVKSGKVLFIPAKVHNIKSYPIKIEGTDVMIGIDD